MIDLGLAERTPIALFPNEIDGEHQQELKEEPRQG
jgi:hypothetical protein